MLEIHLEYVCFKTPRLLLDNNVIYEFSFLFSIPASRYSKIVRKMSNTSCKQKNQTQPPPVQQKKRQESNSNLIPLDLNCFAFKKDGVTPRGSGHGSAASKALSRALLKLIDHILV